jgi:hypothetical protein
MLYIHTNSFICDRHLEDMLNGIAQDIFHHPIEQNFYESNWQSEFGVWAANPDVQQRFSSMVKARATARLKERDGESTVSIEGLHTRQARPTSPFQPRREGGSCVTAYFRKETPHGLRYARPSQPQPSGLKAKTIRMYPLNGRTQDSSSQPQPHSPASLNRPWTYSDYTHSMSSAGSI